MMRLLFACLILGIAAVDAGAALRITEVMSSALNPAGPDDATRDWIEITNYGDVSVSVDGGWKVDDNSFSFSLGGIIAGFSSIDPGESVIIVMEADPDDPPDDEPEDVTYFKSVWSLGSNIKVGHASGSGLGLSSGSDGATVFDSSGVPVVLPVSFGAATPGVSFYWTYSNAAGNPISGSSLGSLSVAGQNDAHTNVNGDVASPGTALPLTSPSTLTWVGGTETWNASGGTNWSGGSWNGANTAVFDSPGGVVTVAHDVSALGLDFRTGGYTLNGPGKITVDEVSVIGVDNTVTINAVLAGSEGLSKFGTGVLVLGAEAEYSGATSIIQGTLRLGTAGALPDASLLTLGSFGTFEMNGLDETVAGINGLGTIQMGAGDLTVKITGGADALFNGFLSGSGDFIVDSSGAGVQELNTTVASLNAGAVKDYTGRTVVKNGALRVNITGTPTQTSQVLLEGGRLILSTNEEFYTFGASPATEVVLAGGTIEQEENEMVTLQNAVVAGAPSTLKARVDPDSNEPGVLALDGPISGSANLTVTGGGRVAVNGTGTYGGTFHVAGADLRVNGAVAAADVLLEGDGMLSGHGTVDAISGSGTVAPGESAGILTAVSADVSEGMDFAFEFSGASPNFGDPLASGNDILRLTGANPLGLGLDGDNLVRIFLSVVSLEPGDGFVGGFFLDQDSAFSGLISGAAFEFYVLGDGAGLDALLDGQGYYTLAHFNSSLAFEIGTLAQAADFGGGSVNGGIMTLTAVPEPSTIGLILGGIGFLAWRISRRRRVS